MPSRSLLLVAHLAPPATMSAARRVAGLTRHLSRLGHRVTVLTSIVSGSGPVDGAWRTIRVRDLMVSRLNWRAGSFAALQGEVQSDYAAPSALATHIPPDLQLVGWLPFALPRALRLVGSVDCVITTAPPHSGHLVGLALRQRGVPWVADFRDGWNFGPARPPFSPAAAAADRALERAVVRRADTVVAVTRPIADDLAARFGVPTTTVTNGFDPDERPDEAWTVPLDARRHSLVHTGTLAYGGRSAQPLLAAVRSLATREAARLEIVFAGPTSAEERAALADPALPVRSVGSLPRGRALALQRAADSLLVITGDDQPSVSTGKLYEYLAAHRPILVLGDGSEAARIVRETGAGLVSPAADPARIADALRELVERPPAPASGAAVDRFSYARLATRVAALVEDAIAYGGPCHTGGPSR
jgi:glycosyltransferase involved in cell wall biosynthesis